MGLLKRAAAFFRGLVARTRASASPVPTTSHGFKLATRRFSLSRNQKRLIVRDGRPKVPKLLRYARTSNGWASGRV